MRIILIYVNRKISGDAFRLISALLRRDGHQLQIVNVPKQFSDDISEDELRLLGKLSMQSEMVMMSVYSIYEHHAGRITRFLKELRPERPVIWGGPHCIGSPENSLKFADGVCYSEGDIAVPRFVRLYEAGDKAYLQTPNMAFRVNESFQINPLLPLVDDLDSLPFNDFSFENEWVLDKMLIPVTKEVFANYSTCYPFHSPAFPVLSARGCPHKCSYCTNIRYLKMYPGLKIRRQSVSRMIAEIKHMMQRLPNIKCIRFVDDDFFARPENELQEFITVYKKEINLPCSVSISANTFTTNKLTQLRKLDLVIVQVGVQTCSQRVMEDIYNRTITVEKTKKAIDEISAYLNQGNMKLLIDIIIDNPYETQQDILETYKFIARLHPKIFITLFLLSFFPGSTLYERALRDKFITDEENYLARDFRSRKIRYQVNYPMLLIIIGERFQFMRRLPLWMKVLLVSQPVRILMKCFPRPVIAWALRTVPKWGHRINAPE